MQHRSAVHEDPNLYSKVIYHLSYVPLAELVKLRPHVRKVRSSIPDQVKPMTYY